MSDTPRAFCGIEGNCLLEALGQHRCPQDCDIGDGIRCLPDVTSMQRELAAAQAKLAKYEQAQMPEEPDARTVTGRILEKYVDDLRTFTAAQTIRAEELQRLLIDAHDCMEAFTDPEGSMPEDTGEFRDLSRVMMILREKIT